MTRLNEEQIEGLVAELPPLCEAAARAYPPGWYRNTNTGQYMLPLAYGENDDGTCTTSRCLTVAYGCEGFPIDFICGCLSVIVLDVPHAELEPVSDKHAPDYLGQVISVYLGDRGLDS